MMRRRLLNSFYSAWIALSFAALGAGCSGGFPAEVTAIPFTCDRGAECGAGQCLMEEGEALCLCAPGSARTHQYICEPLVQGTACHGARCEGVLGCTSPGHCAEGELCERLTGRCVPAEAAACEDRAPDQEQGERPLGGTCYFRSAAPGSVSGCGTADADDLCQPGLVCVPTGPYGYSLVCGAPENAIGVCRKPCALCPGAPGAPDGVDPNCGEAGACFYVEGYGGVCFPEGYAEGECGEGLCRPGESCVLGGTLRGYAVGRCRVPCAEGERCPEPGQTCQPGHERLLDQLFCAPE